MIRIRYVKPKLDADIWESSGESRQSGRLPTTELSAPFGVSKTGSGVMGGGNAGVTTYASTWDPNSAFGFSAKIENYTYRLLGERSMLASVEAADSPEQPCALDGGRSVCPENWEMRHIYVIEATAKPRGPLADSVVIPKRILYVDSEGWFITASDQYNDRYQLSNTLVTFHAYQDRPGPNARVAIWPFKRLFQTAMVDEAVTEA